MILAKIGVNKIADSEGQEAIFRQFLRPSSPYLARGNIHSKLGMGTRENHARVEKQVN